MKKEELHKFAVAGREKSYSPYSGFKVGAALRLTNQAVASGANIENASYGGTVCSERVAIWKALHENPGQKVEEMVVVTDAATAWPPCGFCRQVLAEFSKPETLIHVANLQGIQKTFRFDELLPLAFTPEHLGK